VARGKPAATSLGGEAKPAVCEVGSSGRSDLLTQMLARENLRAALKRVQRNRGSAGVDGMTVAELPMFLRTHWPRIRAELEAGRYRPQPVRRRAIPKPGGGERELGIPTVLDRLIQQALLQVWRRGTTMFRELRARGASFDDARRIAANSRRWWANGAKALNRVLPVAYFDALGVPRLS